MKKIFLILFAFISVNTFAQVDSTQTIIDSTNVQTDTLKTTQWCQPYKMNDWYIGFGVTSQNYHFIGTSGIRSNSVINYYVSGQWTYLKVRGMITSPNVTKNINESIESSNNRPIDYKYDKWSLDLMASHNIVHGIELYGGINILNTYVMNNDPNRPLFDHTRAINEGVNNITINPTAGLSFNFNAIAFEAGVTRLLKKEMTQMYAGIKINVGKFIQ